MEKVDASCRTEDSVEDKGTFRGVVNTLVTLIDEGID